MAAMLTVLTEFADNGNSRTYTQATHTAQEPDLCIQKRRTPTGGQVTLEDSINVLMTTKDSAGAILPQKVSMSVTVRRPIDGLVADVDAALVIFRDIIAGDEFANTVASQEFLV